MWTRAELKGRAKERLRVYYWMAFLVSLIVGFLGFEGSVSGNSANFMAKLNESGEMTPERARILLGVLMVTLAVQAIVFVVLLILKIFVGNPVVVGGKRFYMESRAVQRSAGVGKVFHVFGCGYYVNVVKTMFLRDLFVSLWTLLLVVPGIIKAYEYYMVPYILAENPDMNYKEVLNMSKEMMRGNKWDTFVLELSFFGWMLLGLVCCCIGVLFVVPYMEATFAELYGTLRSHEGYRGLRGFGGSEDEFYDNVVSEQ